MAKKTYTLTDPDGPPYAQEEVKQILGLRDDGTLPRWRKDGTGPAFFRKGRKHSRVLYPRREFWSWFLERTFSNEDEAERVAQ